MRTLFGRKRPLSFLFGAVLGLALAGPGDAGAARIKAWVTFNDKGPAVASLSGRAFEDAPVYAPYLDALRGKGFEVSTTLRWQNKVSGWLDDSGAVAVRALPFVRSLEEMPRKAPRLPDRTDTSAAPASDPLTAPSSPRRAAAQDFGAFQSVFETVGAAVLRDTVVARGLAPGEGVRIAVLDDGFRLGHKAFDSLYARGAIVDQWDFVDDTAVAVTRTLGASHGASTLSQIAGDLPGVLQGLAPRARFLLYRTEDDVNESYVEEDYLAAALERAVDSGAQVISLSLGYRYDFDSGAQYPYSMMDGRTRPSSIAALGAARRGALVVASIGNEGGVRDSEPTLTAPSDADSILAVGSVTATESRCSYSGTGPSFDGRTKPEIASTGCSVPVVNPTTSTGYYNQSGTSFAAPVVAGVAALLWQLHSDSTAGVGQRIRRALMASAAGASHPDDLVGNGLLRAAAAHDRLNPRALKGTLAWRSRGVTLPWANVDPADARLWDARGRERRVRAHFTPEGNLSIEPSSGIMAQGAYLLRIPKAKK